MSQVLENLLTPSEIADLHRPIHEARGLPGKAYGEAFYQLEQRELFPRTWCAIGTGADVPNPGDVMALDLAGAAVAGGAWGNRSDQMFLQHLPSSG